MFCAIIVGQSRELGDKAVENLYITYVATNTTYILSERSLAKSRTVSEPSGPMTNRNCKYFNIVIIHVMIYTYVRTYIMRGELIFPSEYKVPAYRTVLIISTYRNCNDDELLP